MDGGYSRTVSDPEPRHPSPVAREHETVVGGPDPVPEPAQADWYRTERYLGERPRPRKLAGYYAIKPLLPRSVQLALRRAYATRQRRRRFPAWPIEPVLVRLQHDAIRAELRRRGVARLPFVNFWPDGRRFAWILTHDVEGPAGVQRIPSVLDVERRHGAVSSWNVVAEWYPIPPGTFERVREAGGEIGLHAVRHDGKLFSSREHFEGELPQIHGYVEAWGVDGFRSPATHRNADWMPELGCRYDSSFPDTDPFEPQPGGCCSIHPFFLGDMVELPVTLVQDHTLFEILRCDDIAPWLDKAGWVARHHGLVNVITHPDYLDTAGRRDAYGGLVAAMAARDDGWHALPRDVAAWWRTRAGLRVTQGPGGDVAVTGPGAERATIAWATLDGDDVVFDIGA
ncbi:MAG: hypothetical protein QOF04_3704 [Solirubrobacteraceae bacterium]|nr:hypothetical protein [Solirubrobacteraceae bacterium]